MGPLTTAVVGAGLIGPAHVEACAGWAFPSPGSSVHRRRSRRPRRNKPNQILPRDPGLLSAARRYASYPGGHAEGYPDSFKQCFNAFYSYIAAGDFSAPAPFPTFLDGHKEIVLCAAILKSHREQQQWAILQHVGLDHEDHRDSSP